jgi:tRNA splicing endonuclease
VSHPLDIFHAVTLLGIYKKEPDESLEDVKLTLMETGMYPKEQADEVFVQLREWGYITDTGLTFVGVTAAKQAEQEFIEAEKELPHAH